MTVLSLHGGPIGERVPNENCVELCEELLEMARSGEIVGIGAALLYFDGLGGFQVGGIGGSYSHLGASVAMTDYLSEMTRNS